MSKNKLMKSIISCILVTVLLLTTLPFTRVRAEKPSEIPNNAKASVARGEDAFQKSDYDFQANWIWSASDDGGENRWMAFRKEISLESSDLEEKITARIAADSKYWLYINGELAVFEGQLKRGAAILKKDIYELDSNEQPNLDEMLEEVATYYDEVDLTPFLQEGNNTITALVWYLGNEGHSHIDSGQGGFLFESQMGSQSVLSDDTWLVSRHRGYQKSSKIDGLAQEFHVVYDAREGFNNFIDEDYETLDWENAQELGKAGDKPWNELWPRTIPEWKVWDLKKYTLADEELYQIEGSDTRYRLDLPTNIQFTPYIKVKGPEGSRIKISCPNSGETSVTYILSGASEGEEYESPVWINWWFIDYQIPEGVELIEAGYRQSGYNTEFEGYFESDSEFYNTLWRKARDTAYVNIRDTFMDCPDRERAGWLGDAVNEMQIAYYSMSPSVFDAVRKDISTRINWQNQDGVIPSTAPASFRYNEWAELPGQSLAGVMSWFQYYLYSGDRTTLEIAYPALQKYMETFGLDLNNYSDPFERGSGVNTMHRNWIDWGPNMDQHLCLNIWAYIGVQTLCDFAEELGDTGNLTRYSALRDSMRSKFDMMFWNGEEYRSSTYKAEADDRAHALAVYAGLVSPDKYPAVRDILLNNQFASPYMVKYSIEALYLMGYTAQAEQRMKESYENDVLLDAPTFSENWNGGGTQNHGWSGGGLIALSGYAAGVRPLTAGYESFIVAPQMEEITEISAGIPSIKGTIHVSAKKQDGRFEMIVEVPQNSTGLLGVPRLDNKKTAVECDGKIIWKNGFAAGEVSGLAYAYTDENHIFFEAEPGIWELHAIEDINEPKSEHKIEIPVLQNGTITINGEAVSLPYSESFSAHMEITVEAIADQGYLFDIFSGSFGSRESKHTFILDEDFFIDASFVKEWDFKGNVLTVKSNTEDSQITINGRTVPNPYQNLFDYDEEIELNAYSSQDYKFIEWRDESGNIVSEEPEFKYRLTQKEELEAVFMSQLGPNLALGKEVTASSNIQNNMFDKSKLTDGIYTITGVNEGWTSTENAAVQWFYVDMGETVTFDIVKLFPRHNGTDNGYGIPLDLEIKISDDAIDWVTIHEEKDIERVVSGAHRFAVGEQTARYIMVHGSRLRQNPMDDNRTRFQVSEVEIFSSSTEFAPIIQKQPQDVIASPGEQASFYANTISAVPAQYQWYVSANPEDGWERIQNADKPRLTFTASVENSKNWYMCEIENEYGTTRTEPALFIAAGENYALKRPVTASTSQDVGDYFRLGYINDGVRETMIKTNEGWTSQENKGGSEWVCIDLEEIQTVDMVVLYPRYDGTNDGYGIPIDYRVQVSKDNINWITVYEVTDFERPLVKPVYIEFAPVNARYLKVEGTKIRPNPADDNRLRMQIAELEIYKLAQDTGLDTLKELIKYAENLQAADYKEWSWEVMQGALDKARMIAEKGSDADEKDIDHAYNLLDLALNLLVKKAEGADKMILDIVIQAAQEAIDSGEVDEALEEIQNGFYLAFNNAKDIYELQNADKEQIISAALDLLENLHRLGFKKALKQYLQELYEVCSKIELRNYKPGAEKDNFIEALKGAAEVLADPNVVQEEVDSAYDKLFKAARNLIPLDTDKSLLREAIELAETYQADGVWENYVDKGKDEFLKALEKAKEIYRTENVSQSEIDQAQKDLLRAVAALRLKADKSLLEKAVKTADGLDESLYTPASLAAFKASYSSIRQEAIQMLNDESLSEDEQEIVEQMAQKIQHTLDLLIRIKPEESDSTEQSGDSNEIPDTGGNRGTDGETESDPDGETKNTTGKGKETDESATGRGGKMKVNTSDTSSYAGLLLAAFVSIFAVIIMKKQKRSDKQDRP